ncbi:Sua5/YciO/YrdC/YwlC family protein [Shigella sonnei]
MATLRRANIARRNRWRSCCQWLTIYQTLRASCLPRPPRRLCWWIKKYVPELCDDTAPGLNEVGVMLPANPLQHLLLQELQCPLVMTSGNLTVNHRLSATNRRWRICRALPTDS